MRPSAVDSRSSDMAGKKKGYVRRSTRHLGCGEVTGSGLADAAAAMSTRGGAGGGVLRSVLTVREAGAISATTRNKIEAHFENLDTKLKKLQNEAAENSKKHSIRQNNDGALSVLEAQLISAHAAVFSAQENVKALKNDCEELRKEKNSSTDERNSLQILCNRQNKEIADLKNETLELMTQLKKAIDDKCVALSKIDELHNKEHTLEVKEKNFEKEKIHFDNQIQNLTKDIKKYAADLKTIQSECDIKVFSLESKLAEDRRESDELKTELTNMKKANSELTLENKNLKTRLISQDGFENNILADCKKELDGKTKLLELYTKTIDETNSKNDQLNDNLSDLKKLYNSLMEQMKEIDSANRKLKMDYDTLLNENNAKILSLESELNEAKTRLSATKEENLYFFLKDLSPYASSTCELIKSMSLTQVYGELVKLSEGLDIEKQASAKLMKNIESLTNENAEKENIIKNKVDEIQSITQNNSLLLKELESVRTEYDKLKKKNEEVSNSYNVHMQENKKLKSEVDNLSRQICYLLDEKELEENESAVDGNSSSQKELVTFSGIRELQSNNLKLLNLVEELKDNINKDENRQNTKDVQVVIDSLNDQVNELKKTQRDQIKIIDALTTQRDRYEKLYRQNNNLANTTVVSDGKNIAVPTSEKTQSVPGSDQKSLESQLVEAKNMLKEQSEKYHKYKEGMLTSEKILTEQLEVTQKKLYEINNMYAKCLSISKTSSEKCQILEKAVDTYKNQVSSLEERNKIYESSIIKQEESIKFLRDELLDSMTKLSTAEIMLENVRQEFKILKDSESRIKKERDLLKKERFSQSLILNEIEHLKVSEKRMDDEYSINLKSKLNMSIKECAELQSKIKSQEDQITDLTTQLDIQMKEHENRYKESNLIIEKNKTEILSLYDQLNAKTSQIDELNNKLLSLINVDQRDKNSDVMEKAKDLESALVKHKTEIDSLQKQLIVSKQEVQEYKSKANNTDEELKKIDSSFKEYKNVMEKTLNSLRESEKNFKEKALKLEAELSSQPRDINIMNTNDLKTELIQSRKTVDDLKLNVDNKIKLIDDLNMEINNMKDLVQKANEKYAHEMLLHSTDILSMSQLKQELKELKSTIAELSSEKNNFETALQKSKLTWDAREKEIISERESLMSQLNDLNQQNSLLHEQIQIQSENANISQIENTSLNANDDKSVDHLLNIIKLLRREKDIINTKLEIITAEKSRLKSELEIVMGHLEELKQNLEKENENSKSKEKLYNNSEVIRKLETFNALTDNNVLLRQERDNLLKKVNELSEKSSKMEVTLSTSEKNGSILQAKVDSLKTENINLKTESVRWRNRVTSLVEKANKTSPEDWKRLQNERETLAKMLTTEKENAKKLNDEIVTLKTHKAKIDEEINLINQKNILLANNFKKQSEELNTVKNDISKITQELVDAKVLIEEKTNALKTVNETLAAKEASLDDISKREINIRKIAKKYKVLYDDLVKSSETKVENDDSTTSETQVEATDQVAKLTAQIDKVTEENANLMKEISALRTFQDSEKQLQQELVDSRTTIAQLTESNTSLSTELASVKCTVQIFEQNFNDTSTKLNTLDIQYREHIAQLEKEKNQCEQDKNSISADLNKKIEYLLHKLRLLHQKQDCNQPKPSTSSYQGDQSPSETPTIAKIATGSVASSISSSACSSQNLTENLPSSSSPTTCHLVSQFCTSILPPESTQDLKTENLREIRAEASEDSTLTQTADEHQTISINPHVETVSVSGMETIQTHQQAASSSCTNINNSNSTVTTSHRNDDSENVNRARKRHQSVGDTNECDNRSKLQRLAEIESEYQLPTSSQRDQEDDCVIVDSADEVCQETVEDDEDKAVNNDVLRNANLETENRNSSTENNEVEMLETVPQGESNSNRLRESSSIANNILIPPSPINQQQIETISSVTEGNEGGNGYMSLGMGNVGSAGTSYDDGSDSIVPSTPVLYVPRRNDGFGEAVSSPLTVSGASGAGGHFTFNQSDSGPTSGVIEDTHADLTNQIAPHLPITPESENAPVQESCEAEVGGSSQESAGEGSPMVSSQGSLPASPQQIEEGSEAEASSTAIANTANRKGPWTRASHASPQTSEYRAFSQRSPRQLRPTKGKDQFKRNQ